MTDIGMVMMIMVLMMGMMTKMMMLMVPTLRMSLGLIQNDGIFVRNGIYDSVADYNSTWQVSSVCVCRG